MIIEALAQTCGLLMNLRWLAARDFDVAAFAAAGGMGAQDLNIPHSVLAETRMSQKRLVRVGDRLALSARVRLQRGSQLGG